LHRHQTVGHIFPVSRFPRLKAARFIIGLVSSSRRAYVPAFSLRPVLLSDFFSSFFFWPADLASFSSVARPAMLVAIEEHRRQ